jgi:predicted nucleic acid-binding protein
VKVLVDTSALLALLDEDDLHHRVATETLGSLIPTAELVTHNYIQVETLVVARRRLGPGVVGRLVDVLFAGMATIWVDESFHQTAMSRHRAVSSVSVVDHVSFEVMRRERIDVAFTYDADFEAQGFRRAVPTP